MWPFRKRIPPGPPALTLDQALAELRGCGVALNPEVTAEAIAAELSGDPAAVDRVELLCVLGGEADSGQGGACSDDIWHVDSECIEDHNAYVALALRFMALARGDLPLTRLHDYVSVQEGKAWFEFTFQARTVRWDLEVQDDWMDPGFYSRFQDLLKAVNSPRRFMIAGLGQDALVLCGDEQKRQAMSRFSGLEFKWQ